MPFKTIFFLSNSFDCGVETPRWETDKEDLATFKGELGDASLWETVEDEEIQGETTNSKQDAEDMDEDHENWSMGVKGCLVNLTYYYLKIRYVTDVA